MAIPDVVRSSASRAGPPSPEYPVFRELPAVRVTIPFWSSLKTQFELMKYRIPDGSEASPRIYGHVAGGNWCLRRRAARECRNDVLLRLRNERGTHQCKAARTLLVVFVFPLLPGDIERQRT